MSLETVTSVIDPSEDRYTSARAVNRSLHCYRVRSTETRHMSVTEEGIKQACGFIRSTDL